MTTWQILPDEAPTATADPARETAPAAPRIAAVVGHADDPDLLRRWIRHHISIGLEHIFVEIAVAAAQLQRGEAPGSAIA